MKLSNKTIRSARRIAPGSPAPANFTFLRLLSAALLTGSLAAVLGGCSTGLPENGLPETGSPAKAAPSASVKEDAEAVDQLTITRTTTDLARPENAAADPAIAQGAPLPATPQFIPEAARTLRAQNAAGDALATASSMPKYHYPHPIIEPPVYRPQPNTEKYPATDHNAVQQVATNPVSTFSIDVDTAAYANTRRTINSGLLPNRDMVRVEEFINYFNYSYAEPDRTRAPFSVTTEVGPSPWNEDRKLMLVGLQGYDIDRSELPPANLVFLIDVSGSMNNPQKLGLLKSAMKMLTQQLRPQDTIAIAVYAGAAGQVLEPTPGNERHKIIAAIDALRAGGSTNGGAGIDLAYAMADRDLKEGGINRVILATDGDFNVGARSPRALGDLVEAKRKTGVALTVLGFGAGNYNDAIMQELAQKGNGNAAYIDTLNEARKVLVDEMGATLETIAKDVKIQVEFNPTLVSEYRLIGYETRHLNREDFNNDKVDAGEIGAGHSVTALYELTLNDANKPTFDKLRYGPEASSQAGDSVDKSSELAHVKLRYKAPAGTTSKLLEQSVAAGSIKGALARTSENYRLAAAASAFGQLLRGSNYTGSFDYGATLQLAQSARGQDSFGYRRELENLLRTAAALTGEEQVGVGVPEQLSMR